MSAAQLQLFEPTGGEVGALALQHLALAEKAQRNAATADARGWPALADAYRLNASEQLNEAECLAMLAELEFLGRVGL